MMTLAIVHDPLVIAIATPLAMILGAMVMPFFLPTLRPYALDLVFGAREIFTSRRLSKEVLAMFFKSSR